MKGINVGLASRRQPVLAYSRRIQVAELIPIYLPTASSAAVDKSSRRGRRCQHVFTPQRYSKHVDLTIDIV